MEEMKRYLWKKDLSPRSNNFYTLKYEEIPIVESLYSNHQVFLLITSLHMCMKVTPSHI